MSVLARRIRDGDGDPARNKQQQLAHSSLSFRHSLARSRISWFARIDRGYHRWIAVSWNKCTRVCDCIDLMSCSTNGVSSSSNAAGRVGLLAIQIYYPPAYVRQTELGTRHGAIP